MHLTTYTVSVGLLLLQVEARLFGRLVGNKPHRSKANDRERRSKAVSAVVQRNETTTELVSGTEEHGLQKRAFDGHATFYQVSHLHAILMTSADRDYPDRSAKEHAADR